MRALKMRNVVASHWKLTMTSFDDPLTASQEVANKLNVNRCTVIWHLKQIGNVKKVDKWVPHELTKNLKNCHFWSVIFSYSMQQQRSISQSDCDVGRKVNCIWQLAMASSMAGPRKSSKALHKAKLVLQKRAWSLFGSLLLVWPTTAFWILGKPLHLRSMLDES